MLKVLVNLVREFLLSNSRQATKDTADLPRTNADHLDPTPSRVDPKPLPAIRTRQRNRGSGILMCKQRHTPLTYRLHSDHDDKKIPRLQRLATVSRILSKAAPRFELGIKDLQSSALPLGHAATGSQTTSLADRISETDPPLLVISNGHGEDLIALKIIEALHRLQPAWKLKVLPLVGEGNCFQAAVNKGWVEKIGPSAGLPSGGFSNQSLRALLSDLLAGLPLLTWRQWICMQRESRSIAGILAVGDLLPLLMAWTSRRPFGFIGTPKSDYTWSSGPGQALSDPYHALKGSEWDPWEWLLMKRRSCHLVAMRDRLTARGLRRHGVKATSPGNPMMDGLGTSKPPASLERCRRVLLLCGSRIPEALHNFRRLISGLMQMPSPVPLAVLAALGSKPHPSELQELLQSLGFRSCPPPSSALEASACWVRGPLLLLIGPGQFQQWVAWAEAGVATAGTATEQMVGLGIPALSLPGRGPQFTRGFAERQSRLLGGAVRTCESEEELGRRLNQLLNDPLLRQEMGRMGRQRMGPSGGSEVIARAVVTQLAPKR